MSDGSRPLRRFPVRYVKEDGKAKEAILTTGLKDIILEFKRLKVRQLLLKTGAENLHYVKRIEGKENEVELCIKRTYDIEVNDEETANRIIDVSMGFGLINPEEEEEQEEEEEKEEEKTYDIYGQTFRNHKDNKRNCHGNFRNFNNNSQKQISSQIYRKIRTNVDNQEYNDNNDVITVGNVSRKYVTRNKNNVLGSGVERDVKKIGYNLNNKNNIEEEDEEEDEDIIDGSLQSNIRKIFRYMPMPPSHYHIIRPDEVSVLSLVGKGRIASVYISQLIISPQERNRLMILRDPNQLYALKTYDKEMIISEGQIEHVLTEYVVLKCINSCYLAHLDFAFQTKNRLFFGMTFGGGGELFFHLRHNKRFNENLAVFYIAEVICGIEELHRHNIIYRDLKPENVLLTIDGHIILADFGLAKIGITANSGLEARYDKYDNSDDSSDMFGSPNSGSSCGYGVAQTLCGTPEYVAPEVLIKNGHGKCVDWWSCGIMLYEMIFGASPFNTDNASRDVVYRRIVGDCTNFDVEDINIPFNEYFSPEAVDFIRKLLIRNPSKRLGSKGSAEIKNHPIFRRYGINFDKIAKRECIPPYVPRIDRRNPAKNFSDQTSPLGSFALTKKSRGPLTEEENSYFRDVDWTSPFIYIQ